MHAELRIAEVHNNARYRACMWYVSWWLHWLSLGLVIERSRVRLPARALSSQLGQLSLPSLRGSLGKSSTGLHGWG